METKLYQLLESKSFNELNTTEKSYVLGLMSQKEYESSHFLLKQTKATFSEGLEVMEPNPLIFKDLKAVFNKKYGAKSRNRSFNLESILEIFLIHKKWSLVGLGALITIGFVLFEFSKESEITTTAMDISKIKNFSEMNKHLYLDDIYMEPDSITPINELNEME
ncbi:MAG: hypothetical protein AAF090_06520 [Bacteroidota bacterium]